MSAGNKSEITSGEVTLKRVDIDKVKLANPVNNTDLDWEKWRNKANVDLSVDYFGIFYRGKLVGEIFLHDIDINKKEALIGYHIFDPEVRGKGVGGLSLQLLVEHAKNDTELNKLVIITSSDNVASRKIAEKNGFKFSGPSWEDQSRVAYERMIR